MEKEKFLSLLELDGVLVAKRCTEAYLTKHGLLGVLDSLVPVEFGTIGERIKHLKYGGGYCLVCGTRTRLSKSATGFNEYCKYHFHEPKKGLVAHNRKDVPPKSELEELYFTKQMTLLSISDHYGNVSNVTIKKWFDHYGIQLLTHSEVIKKRVIPKSSETCQEKYGNRFFFGSEEGKQKVAEAFIKKYGVPYHPIQNPSMEELEVLKFFNSIEEGFKTDTEVIGMELDGYNEKLGVAFEYHGLYWHGEDRKEKSLHYRKYKKCAEKGIRLFSIFSSEWKDRNEQVKNFIRASLGKYDEKIYARNCAVSVRGKHDREAINFLEKFHIQGSPNIKSTKEFYCLETNGELVSVISIGSHPRKTEEMCLTRMATKAGLKIVGGAKRLMSYISKKYDSILTWSDNRWTEGNTYKRLGFKLIAEYRQDYYYTNGKVLIPKQAMTKKKIGAPEEITEEDYVNENFGYVRIWDCGKKAWRLE